MEALAYMLTGGALVVAGLFMGAWLPRVIYKEQNSPPEQENPVEKPQEIRKEDLKKAQELKDQWNNLLHYNGRDQKAGGSV